MEIKRGKGKITIDVGLAQGYKHYCEAVKDLPQEYKISQSLYGKIIKHVHDEIAKELLNNAESFRMPAGLPQIRVRKFKRKIKFNEDGTVDTQSLPVNWKATRELWEKNEDAKKKKKRVYFLNDHRDGYSANFIMEKFAANIKNLQSYRFKATRTLDRELSAIWQDPYNKTDYYT